MGISWKIFTHDISMIRTSVAIKKMNNTAGLFFCFSNATNSKNSYDDAQSIISIDLTKPVRIMMYSLQNNLVGKIAKKTVWRSAFFVVYNCFD